MTTLLNAARQALEALKREDGGHHHRKATRILRTAITEAEKAEPVAWAPRAIKDLPNYHGMRRGAFKCDEVEPERFPLEPECFELVPLYTHPPQRQPLTDEQMLALILPITHDAPSTYAAMCYESGPYDLPKLRSSTIALIRAVEHAHGIGYSAARNDVEMPAGLTEAEMCGGDE